MQLRLALRFTVLLLATVPAQAQSWTQLSPARPTARVAFTQNKLSLRLDAGATASGLNLVVSGGQPGNPAFLLARSARATGSSQLANMKQVHPDVVVPLGSFDAIGEVTVQVGSLARSLGRGTVWLQAASSGGTSSPLHLSAALVDAWIRPPVPGGWCGTHQHYVKNLRGGAPSYLTCPELGPCDNPVTRDGAWTANTSMTIRLSIHVFCHRGNCAATQGDVDAAVLNLNLRYATRRIQFVYETEFINSKKYRNLASNETYGMKNNFADSPATKLNVYVVDTGGNNWGTFPWTANALNNQGGIVMNEFAFVNANSSVFTHEVGHCLGLWHTFHGVTEVTQCSECYEGAGRTDGDVTGDKCSDTQPTTNHYACSDPGGNDPCLPNNPWGATPYLNYMGYSIIGCASSSAFNFTQQQAGRMHCWTTAVLSGWLEVPVGPPAAPTNLSATKLSSSSIRLDWIDNANNESSFAIERSPLNNTSWAAITSVGASVTSFSDTGLDANKLYYYRVRASNTGGYSAYSNTASATTDPPAPPGDATANQDISVSGTISGSYIDTHASDDGYESITEQESGGKPSKRYSFLEHKWTIAVLPGNSFTFYVEAHKTVSSDGDDFVFAWSSDGQTYTDMLTVTKTADNNTPEPAFLLPGGLSGTIYIRVRDIDRTSGNRTLDTISIDQMFIRSQ